MKIKERETIINNRLSRLPLNENFYYYFEK